MGLFRRRSRVAAMVASRRVEPSQVPIEGSLTEQFRLEPMSDVCPSTGCDRLAPRHSVCAGSICTRIPQWWKHGNGAGDDEIGIACECRVALWLVGEGNMYALSPREWKAAVLDFAVDLGHDRADRRVHREARALAKCIAALRSGIIDDPAVARTSNCATADSRCPGSTVGDGRSARSRRRTRRGA